MSIKQFRDTSHKICLCIWMITGEKSVIIVYLFVSSVVLIMGETNRKKTSPFYMNIILMCFITCFFFIHRYKTGADPESQWGDGDLSEGRRSWSKNGFRRSKTSFSFLLRKNEKVTLSGDGSSRFAEQVDPPLIQE
jgi:hypothetical protein